MLNEAADDWPSYRIISLQRNESFTLEDLNHHILFDISLNELLNNPLLLRQLSATDKKIIASLAEENRKSTCR